MNDDQVERLIEELVKTRESFSQAIDQIKWNRRNTMIQYALIVLVMIMVISGVAFYQNDKHNACVRGNDLRSSIEASMDSNAIAIGVALSVVTEAPQAKFDEYMQVYKQQEKPKALSLREC